MKKLLVLSTGIAFLMLCSFGFQKMEIRKTATNLYLVTSTKKIAAADQEELKKIVADHYGIKDWNKTMVIGKNNPMNKASGSLIDNSVYKDFFSSHFISWKNMKLPEEGMKAQTILAKYAR